MGGERLKTETKISKKAVEGSQLTIEQRKKIERIKKLIKAMEKSIENKTEVIDLRFTI